MKKWIAGLLSVIMLLAMAPALAEDVQEDVHDTQLLEDVTDEKIEAAAIESDEDSSGDESLGDEDEDEEYDGELITVEDYAITEDLPDDWWNILLLGTDNRYTTGSSYGRTDSMIILSVNPATKEAKLTSLMRDIWVKIEGKGSNKLNAACVYGGPELTIQTINANFGMNISDYVLINITGLADVIDELGGIDIDVTKEERDALNKGLFDLSSQSGMEELEEYGENVHLNGNQAVAYSRIRKIDSDYQRTVRQRYVLTEIAKKLIEENSATSIVGVVNTLIPYVETNLDLTDIMTLAYIGLQLDVDNIGEFRIPADGTYESGTYDGVWCIKPDFEENSELLYDFIYGDDDET